MAKSLMCPLVRKINIFSSRFSADGIVLINSRSLMLTEAEIRNPSRHEASSRVCRTYVHYLNLYKEFSVRWLEKKLLHILK